MGSQITKAPDLNCSVVIDSGAEYPAALAETIFRGHGMLVLDDVPWSADINMIRTVLVKKRRAFKDPFNEKEPPKLVRKEIRKLVADAETLFTKLYPNFKPLADDRRLSFRPMITGPEPIHFDTYGGLSPLVTAYINVSRVPRVYNIGPNFADLVREQPDVMREMMKIAEKEDRADLSYVIRQHTVENKPPLDKQTPRHRVELAPGSIWFFNAKTVSHEVVYGEGAVGVAWEVPDCGARMQNEILKEMLCEES